MLFPSLASLLDQVNSRYLLVNIIAKRARDISTNSNEKEEYLEGKPVSMAIAEIASGALRVTIPEDFQ